MINPEIFKLADQMKAALKEQQDLAHQGLAGLPDGPLKSRLKGLLAEAGTGKMSIQEVQKQLQKIQSECPL